MERSLAIVIFSWFVPALALETVTLWPSGEIRGKTITTQNGREISAYLGIPYAEPPVGPNRFKAVGLKDGWDGVIPGDEDGNMCPQLNDDGQVVGDEDPKPESAEKLYPTMIYFHGGWFVRGSASSKDFGPEYLLDRDIVLVTVNYRLGALGFLCTGDDVVPGNFGLKDQSVAIQWVKKYIVAFGGLPSSITLFGQGAGGVSSNLHAVSDMSTDLFHRYISQSGNSASFWSHNDRNEYYKYSKKLGEYVNCQTKSTENLVDCLRTVDVEKLVNSNEIFNDREVPFFTWVPTNEHRYTTNPFLTDLPLHKMITRGCPKQSAIIGDVRDGGLMLAADFYVDGPFYQAVTDPRSFVHNATKTAYRESERAHRRAGEFYFENSVTDNKETYAQNMSNFITDLWYRTSTELLTRVLNHKGAPLFLYEFDYRGTYSRTSKITGNNDNIGVTDGDDLNYIFPQRNFEGPLNENDELMIDMMLDFWTSFASTGTPVSDKATNPWKRSAKGVQSTLRIGDNSDPSTQSFSNYDERLTFWDTVLADDISGATFFIPTATQAEETLGY